MSSRQHAELRAFDGRQRLRDTICRLSASIESAGGLSAGSATASNTPEVSPLDQRPRRIRRRSLRWISDRVEYAGGLSAGSAVASNTPEVSPPDLRSRRIRGRFRRRICRRVESAGALDNGIGLRRRAVRGCRKSGPFPDPWNRRKCSPDEGLRDFERLRQPPEVGENVVRFPKHSLGSLHFPSRSGRGRGRGTEPSSNYPPLGEPKSDPRGSKERTRNQCKPTRKH